jgi:hypothetical protein
MASQARLAFDRNAEDVDRLLKIHNDIGGDARGRRYGLEVLNKSAVILITAFWEAYCEDIAAEALEHLVNNVADASSLPKELKKRIAKELKSDQNEVAVWSLADGGWKLKIRARLAALTEERNRKLNTPRAANIDELFLDAIGLATVSDSWKWDRTKAVSARQKLDKYVTLRGAIAHRGQAAASCTKAHVDDYFAHVKQLVGQTGGAVNKFMRETTGKELFGLTVAGGAPAS